MWRCFRCPTAYDIKHRPRDVHIMTDGLFLCIRHVQEEEELPELSPDLFRTLEIRNRMHNGTDDEGRDGKPRKGIPLRELLNSQRDRIKKNASKLRSKLSSSSSSSDIIEVLKKRSRDRDDDSDDSEDNDRKSRNKSMKQRSVKFL